MGSDVRCSFIPPYLMQAVAQAHPELADICRHGMGLDQRFRDGRGSVRTDISPGPGTPVAGSTAWQVHDAGRTTTLPGRLVRSAGEPESGDVSVDEAARGGQATLDLFSQVYGRDSYDDAAAAVVMTVHYDRSYSNAFWNGSQLVFGDGDGTVFERFTKPVDVLAHELTHAVTEFTAGLVYQGQSGALNESVSDVFAACTKQRLLGQAAGEGDWLIGEGIFTPTVNGRALRDMANPGTAYDDPRIGKDPQPAHMDDFVVTSDDNGGVHLNSGIPNRAFYLAATAIGGSAAEGAGAIWYAALTSGRVTARSDFVDFAAATVAEAGSNADAVVQAWDQVGIRPAPASSRSTPGRTGTGSPAPSGGTATSVGVVRSGGLLGQSMSGSVDVAGDDPRAEEVARLARHIEFASYAPEDRMPDMYVYSFTVFETGPADVPERHLTEDQRRLAYLVLSLGE
ncbi:MAG: M4 family metallopeptidase [Nocardioides sp.]